MVENPYEPSTTLWEKWGASNLTKDQGDSSRNHIMYGTISAFFWKHLAGIAPVAPGWSRVRIAPKFGEVCVELENSHLRGWGNRVLSRVEGKLATVAGEVSTVWELSEPHEVGIAASAVLRVSIPDGVVSGAEVVMPCVGKATIITELRSGIVVWQDDSFVVQSLVLDCQRVEHGGVLMHVASGEYQFERHG